MIIIAIDPGELTGWAYYDTLTQAFHSGEQELFQAMRTLEHNIESRVSQPYGVQLVCEDFIFTSATSKKTRQTWSTEGIGIVKYFAEKWGLAPVVIQKPADAKKFATNERLKAIGWYVAGLEGHANDAARHLLVYALGQNIIKPEQI